MAEAKPPNSLLANNSECKVLVVLSAIYNKVIDTDEPVKPNLQLPNNPKCKSKMSVDELLKNCPSVLRCSKVIACNTNNRNKTESAYMYIVLQSDKRLHQTMNQLVLLNNWLFSLPGASKKPCSLWIK